MNHFLKQLILIALLITLVATKISSQHNAAQIKFGLGAEIGHWRPNDLDDELKLSPLKTAKNHPYLGILILKPWRWGMTFRSSVGYWKYGNNKPRPENQTIEIVSILLDLKYSILTNVILMPYVSYGVGWFLGNEPKAGESLLQYKQELKPGIGITVGTGFDFSLARRMSLAMEFKYHYVKFNRVIAFTDNYSGPKISLGLIYLF